MVVGIDARAHAWAGLGRYTRNLIRHLTELPQCPELVLFTPRRATRELADLPRVTVVPVTDSYYSIREQTFFLAPLLSRRVDLMHFLHFNAPVLYRRPSVVTIHDLTRFFFPAQKHRGALHQWVYEEVFRAAVLHASRVIAVSAHTRNDLVRFFPDVAARTVVVPEGVEHERYRAVPSDSDDQVLASLGIRQPYLLFVGVWMSHKNLPRLLEAFRLLRHGGFLGQLVITGTGRTHDEDLPGIIQHLELSNTVVLPGHVLEQHLPALYRQASVFVFPSLYEGFGLPPLEAMACGTPVVASAVASLPEILGDAAAYVDPLSPEDIARGVRRVLFDADYRRALVARGRQQAARYQWADCARATVQVYREALRTRASVAAPRDELTVRQM